MGMEQRCEQNGNMNVGNNNWKDGKSHEQGALTWTHGDKNLDKWKDDNMHGGTIIFIYTFTNRNKMENKLQGG